MKKKYKDYQDYLKSDKWEQVKNDYANSNDHQDCLLCGSDENLEHHHWKYPKDWNDDSHKNIVKICKSCHELAHLGSPGKYKSILDFVSDMSPTLNQYSEEHGTINGINEVLSKVLEVCEVIEIKKLTGNTDGRRIFKFVSGDKYSSNCNFYPTGIWGEVINGTK